MLNFSLNQFATLVCRLSGANGYEGAFMSAWNKLGDAGKERFLAKYAGK